MTVIPLLVALSLCLATASVAFYLWSVRNGDAEHADRLSLLPLEEDRIRAADGPEGDPSNPSRSRVTSDCEANR